MTKALWPYGASDMALWHYGTKALRHYGTMAWHYGSGNRPFGSMALWLATAKVL